MSRNEHSTWIAERHGGEGAVRALREGRPFSGTAQRIYLEVIDELGIDFDALPPIDRVVLKRLAKMEAAARCFDGAALGAAEQGNIDAWEKYQRRAAYLGNSFLRGIKDSRGALLRDGDVIDAALGVVRGRQDGKD